MQQGAGLRNDRLVGFLRRLVGYVRRCFEHSARIARSIEPVDWQKMNSKKILQIQKMHSLSVSTLP
jgi:hypothetical protein